MATLTTSDGTQIFYELHGEGQPPLVFVHGWCARGHDWAAQVDHFSPRHRVVTVDRRGHGRSAVPAGGYTAGRHAADIAEIADAVEVRSAVAVGHAGGAPAVLELARTRPDVVAAVVMVDTIVSPTASIGDPGDRAGAALGAMIDELEGTDGRAALERMYRRFFTDPDAATARAAIDAAIATPLSVAAAELRALAIDTEAVARSVVQPVLWVSVAAADRDRLSGVFRHVQFGEISDSGHFPQIERSAQLNSLIERFLSTPATERPR